jgi:hypothetical protein
MTAARPRSSPHPRTLNEVAAFFVCCAGAEVVAVALVPPAAVVTVVVVGAEPAGVVPMAVVAGTDSYGTEVVALVVALVVAPVVSPEVEELEPLTLLTSSPPLAPPSGISEVLVNFAAAA